MVRAMCGNCVVLHTVSRPSRNSATTPLVSIGTPVWRPTSYRPETVILPSNSACASGLSTGKSITTLSGQSG